MARRILLSLFIPLSAGAAWYLRALQLSLSYEPETALPLPLDQWGWALWGVLGAAALLTLLLTLSEKSEKPLSAYRPSALGAVLQGAGALLLAGGGAWQLYQLYPALRSAETVPAMLMLLGGLGLFGGMKVCLGGKSKAGALLLLSMCAAGAYLVMTYLEISSDPIVRHFEMKMLAIGAAALGAATLCSLAFGAGGRRRFLLLAALTVPLSSAALCTSGSYAQALGLVGLAAASYGFFLSVLFGTSLKRQTEYELVENPFRTGSVHRDAIREAEKKPAAEASSPAADIPPVQAERPAEKPATAPADPAPAAPPVSSAPAAPSPAAPAPVPPAAALKQPEVTGDADFDLSRVDRLLRELEEEKSQK